MSPRKPTTPDVTPPDQIVDIDVSKEMQGSFLEYAYSVIYARALPDARDGLKPVQRRILFQMGEMGLRPDRGHVKSSRVVGDVMGKLHPHGDTAIYDAMVRMAQPFALRLPLVDGHGNFGSLDDGPAAPRYTETLLSAAAMTLIEDLDEDVVDLVPNYDNTQLQPEVLPAAYPNLLVNGAQGIAVGMATNMASHNLVEVIAAARHLIAHSEASLEELERFVPGPDLPTGGIVIGLDGIRDAYRTGRGSFKTRAKVHVENVTARTKGLVVTELPYMVGPERVIEKIKDGVKANKLRGIRDVLNLTDRHNGLRLVVEVKNGFNPEAVLAQLYKHTPMEDSFGMNNVALVDGRPRTLGLRELLEVFVDHRLDVVRRRTEFRLARRRERLHLVDGLLLAIADIDEVIAVIRSSDDADAARTRLMQIFDLSEAQANYILELRLRRLTKFSRIELEAEREDLARQIAELEAILGSGARLREVVSGELQEVADSHGTPRRTVLLDEAGAAGLAGVGVAGGKAGVAGNAQGADGAIPLEVPDTPCWVILSATGRLARTGDDTEPVRSGPRQSHDAVVGVVPATARGEVGLVTNRGNLVRLGVVNTPALAPTAGAPGLAGGQKVEELAHLEKGERVVGLMDLRAEANPLALATAHGVVKRVKAEDLGARENLEVITLAPGDEVVAAWHCADTDVLALVSSDAQLLRFGADAVRPQGRAGRGIAGMKLAAGARVIALGVVDGDDLAGAHVVTIAASSGALPSADPGSAKVTPLDRYPAKGRATGGVRTHRFVRGQDELRLAWVGVAPARAVTAGGRPVALPEPDERRDGSGQALTTAVAAIG